MTVTNEEATYLIKRDGWGRIAKIEIEGVGEVITPAILKMEDLSKIEFGLVPYSLREFDSATFEKFNSHNSFLLATGLSALPPRKIVELLIDLRMKNIIKPLLVTGLALPQNLPFLVYIGADLFDNSMAIMLAHKRVYFHENGFLSYDKMKYIPCSCNACNKLKSGDDDVVSLLREHNTNKLFEQAELIKELIREERLRNFVEAKAKFNPDLTVMLRVADRFEEFNQRLQPKFKKSKLLPTTMESFDRYEIRYFLNRVSNVYTHKSKYALILPCSARKPYLLSKTHRIIRNSLGKLISRVNEIIVSSPLVVPREFELLYPAINYDTPVTGVWSDEEIDFVAKHLSKLLGGFEVIIAHVEGGYKEVVKRAVEEDDDKEVIFTASGSITSKDSLRNLRKELEGLPEDLSTPLSLLNLRILESMLKYQYDVRIDLEGVKVRGKYPKLEFHRDGVRIARVDTNYGLLEVDIPLAEYLAEQRIYCVEIDDFEPSGTIFSGGVLNADRRIRPNDVVVFKNDFVIGVGRAFMSGEEMVLSSKGIAIEVKRKKRSEE
jgi:archaeosine synthase